MCPSAEVEIAFSAGISSNAFIRLGMYFSIMSSSGTKYSTLLMMSDSLKVWKPSTTSGSTSVPPASMMGFWSPQSLEETICQSIFTLDSFSRFTRKGLSANESPMSAQRMVSTRMVTGSSTMGMPSAWKPGASAIAAHESASSVAMNRAISFFIRKTSFLLLNGHKTVQVRTLIP